MLGYRVGHVTVFESHKEQMINTSKKNMNLYNVERS